MTWRGMYGRPSLASGGDARALLREEARGVELDFVRGHQVVRGGRDHGGGAGGAGSAPFGGPQPLTHALLRACHIMPATSSTF